METDNHKDWSALTQPTLRCQKSYQGNAKFLYCLAKLFFEALVVLLRKKSEIVREFHTPNH